MIMKLFAFTLFILISCMLQSAFCTDYAITIKPKGDVFAVEGDSITLECEVVPKDSSVSLQPGVQLSWTWTNQPSFSNSEMPKTYNNVDNNDYKAVSKLQISNITEKHYREYTCTYETVSRSVTLRSYGPQSNFEYGDKIALLHCDLKSNFATLEGWYKEKDDGGNEELPEDGRFSIALNNSLIIKDPHREDAGTYVAHFDTGDECKVQYRATPLVLYFKDKSYRRSEGEDIEIKCKVLGFPKLAVEWHKDGKMLKDGDNVQMLHHDGYENALLKLKSLESNDEGMYRCVIRYNGTETAKTVKLWVDSNLAPLWPAITLVVEVVVLAVIIFLCEKRRKSKEKTGTPLSEQGDTCTGEERESLRHRNTTNNPRA